MFLTNPYQPFLTPFPSLPTHADLMYVSYQPFPYNPSLPPLPTNTDFLLVRSLLFIFCNSSLLLSLLRLLLSLLLLSLLLLLLLMLSCPTQVMGIGGGSDPYIVIHTDPPSVLIGDHNTPGIVKSRTIMHDLNPDWGKVHPILHYCYYNVTDSCSVLFLLLLLLFHHRTSCI